MVEVRLHGDLAKRFGMIWHFDISSPREAVSAIEANFPGFKNRIRELEELGHCFRVRSSTHDYSSDDVGMTLGSAKRIDIIPIVTGSSAGTRFVIGAVLIAANFFSYFNNPYVYQVGGALILGSVVEWLTPINRQNQNNNQSLGSWTFNGPNNELGQNQPVPVIYGEVLTGAYPISGGLASSTISGADSIAPSVSLGGQFDVVNYSPGSTTTTTIFQVSAGPLNLGEPYTYTWTVTGFAGATVTTDYTNRSVIRISVTVALSASTSASLTGTVALSMVGRPVGSTSASTTTVTTSHALTLKTDNLPYIYSSTEIGVGG